MRFYLNVSQVGNNILVREYDSEKGYVNFKEEFYPRLFIPSNDSDAEFVGLHGEQLGEVNPGTIRDCRQFINQYEGIDGFDVYGNNNYVVQYISENYKDLDYDLTKIRVANIDIEVGSPDGFPDPQKAEQPITAMTVYDNFTDTYYVWGLTEFRDKILKKWNLKDTELKFIHQGNVVYKEFATDRAMLHDFLPFWEKMQFHCITGWHIEGFDIIYLVNRIKGILGDPYAKKLSPWKIIKDKTLRTQFGQQVESYEIVGISVMDYLALYKKYTYKAQESYTLDHIAYVELGEQKLNYEEAGSLHKLFLTNFQKYVDYNIKDVYLVKGLDDKMKLLELVWTVAYYAKINYNDTFSPVRTWDTIIYNYLLERNIIVPPSKQHRKDSSFAGAFVKDPIKGFHDWVVSFDLNSLYPHLIMQYNLGPETIVEWEDLPEDLKGIEVPTVESLLDKKTNLHNLKNHKICMSANGQFFKTYKQSFLSVMMEDLYKQRKVHKKTMLGYEQDLVNAKTDKEKQKLKNLISKYNNLQMAMKILLNSAYGAVGNAYFRFFDIRIAEAVTLSGQLSIRWIANKINAYMNKLLKTKDEDYICAIDTDSNYIVLGKFVEAVMKGEADPNKIVNFLDKVAKQKLEPYIQKSYEELADYMNAYANKMFMGREVIAERAVWTGKKRYMLNVWDSEGVRYKEPKLKIMGLEAKKSSTPEICRKKLTEAYKIVVSGNEDQLIKFVSDFKSHWDELSPEEIAFPKSCNNLEKYADSQTVFKKGTPKHVKGALIYNYLLKKYSCSGEHSAIQDGDKIKYIELKVPNPGGERVVAFPGFLPKEFEFEKYIDYDLMFQKTFVDPLTTVLDAVGWHHEKVASLEDLFV